MSAEDRRVCHQCVGESWLSRWIREQGVIGVCSYCDDDEEPCIPTEELADQVEAAFRRHYVRTSDQPDMYESMLLRDKEISYEWDRHGQPVLDAIAEAASVSDDLARDVLGVLEKRHSDFEMAQLGEECEFDADSHYELKSVEDHAFASQFYTIERSLKSETRFFNQAAERFLAQLFGNITGQSTAQGRPAIVTAGPDAEIKGFFRARVFHDHNELDLALIRPDLHLGPPPSRIARAGRMNAHGISVFYGASDPGVALAEVRPPVGSRALVGRFELLRPVRLLDVEALRKVYVSGSIFDPSYFDQLALGKFLSRLGERLTLPVMPDDEPSEYLITQMIADYLARSPDPGLDGILFPSVQCPGDQRNVVLFHHASRVARLDFPRGTEFSARQFEVTADGAEPDYTVWEQIPPPPKTSEPDKRFAGFPFNLGEPGTGLAREGDDGDQREDCLRANTEELSVHHVQSVSFSTDALRVRRYRFEKHEDRF